MKHLPLEFLKSGLPLSGVRLRSSGSTWVSAWSVSGKKETTCYAKMTARNEIERPLHTLYIISIYIYINISVNTDIYTNLNLNLKQCQHHSISILSYQSFWEYSTASAGCDRWGWRLPPLPMDHSLALPPTFAAENSVTVSLSFWDFRSKLHKFHLGLPCFESLCFYCGSVFVWDHLNCLWGLAQTPMPRRSVHQKVAGLRIVWKSKQVPWVWLKLADNSLI